MAIMLLALRSLSYFNSIILIHLVETHDLLMHAMFLIFVIFAILVLRVLLVRQILLELADANTRVFDVVLQDEQGGCLSLLQFKFSCYQLVLHTLVPLLLSNKFLFPIVFMPVQLLNHACHFSIRCSQLAKLLISEEHSHGQVLLLEIVSVHILRRLFEIGLELRHQLVLLPKLLFCCEESASPISQIFQRRMHILAHLCVVNLHCLIDFLQVGVLICEELDLCHHRVQLRLQ